MGFTIIEIDMIVVKHTLSSFVANPPFQYAEMNHSSRSCVQPFLFYPTFNLGKFTRDCGILIWKRIDNTMTIVILLICNSWGRIRTTPT